MSEEVAFSFKKKPIQDLPKHSSISEILPSTDKLKSKIESFDGNNLNNVDYDEQIRAPRINFKTYDIKFPGDIKEVEEEEKLKTENLEDSTSQSKESFDKNFQDKYQIFENKLDYKPANFDLNHNNYTYSSSEINLSNDKLDAIKNLTNNLTTEERTQNPYKLKKPLSIPAVLRPNVDSSPETNNSPTSLSSSLSLGLNITNTNLTNNIRTSNGNSGSFSSSGSGRAGRSASISAINNLNEIEDFEPIEPTHEHWKPNNFSTSCMKCFSNFSIFNNRRRHHCRFCGFIICSNCLFNSNLYLQNSESNESNDLIYIDRNSRLIIPIFKNLNDLQLSKYFKLCKICKNCGNNYLNLLFQLNQINAIDLPFIFIENPFINKDKKTVTIEERKNSFVNNSDWNWSSF